VARCGAESIQESASLAWGTWAAGIGGSAKDAKEGVFRQRTRSSTLDRSQPFEKTESGDPVGVVGVAEGRSKHWHREAGSCFTRGDGNHSGVK
jgi:hypothetical protein